MIFKDTLNQDLNNIFFNVEDFSEIHEINSKPCNIIIDNETLSEKKIKSGLEDIYLSSILFYVKKSDLNFIPEIEKKLKFDNRTYIISNVVDNIEVYEITLSENMGV